MNKRFLFLFWVLALVFLVIAFIKTGYKNTQQAEMLRLREAEILRDEREISGLTARAKWGDTNAARVYLKKFNDNIKLPGERVIIVNRKTMSGEYVPDSEITEANRAERIGLELSIPEKWNKLLWGN